MSRRSLWPWTGNFGRLAAVPAIVLLHLGTYWVATRVNSARPEDALWPLETAVDRAIPHLGWMWPAFWLAYPYVLVGASWAIWRLPSSLVSRAVVAFVAMTVIGASIQMLLPARSPWPADPHPIQQMVHDLELNRPFASLPSMHVAFTVLTALFGVRAARGRRWLQWGFALGAGLISISTVTLKEHFVLDPVAGALLAGGVFIWWYRGTNRDAGVREDPPAVLSHHLTSRTTTAGPQR